MAYPPPSTSIVVAERNEKPVACISLAQFPRCYQRAHDVCLKKSREKKSMNK